METKSDDLTRISVAPPAIPSAPVPPAPTAQEIHEFEIKKLYHEVTDGLEKKNTRTSPLLPALPSLTLLVAVGYDNSVSSLTHALNSLSEESTQRFLQLNFYKMVSILLDQKCVSSSLPSLPLPAPSTPHQTQPSKNWWFRERKDRRLSGAGHPDPSRALEARRQAHRGAAQDL
jgi:hypothetical protein